MSPSDEPSRVENTRHIQIGVVIVAFSSSQMLLDCVSGVLLDPTVESVVVVDNSSDAESKVLVQRMTEQDSRLLYVDPGANLGFARACNEGVTLLKPSTHVFFVNPDVALSRPLSSLVEHLEASNQAIVAGRLISPGHLASVNARPIVSMWLEAKKAFIGTRAYRQALPGGAGTDADHPLLVGQVDGALLGMSVETYTLLDGFDPQFELYFEDVDICARAAALGGCLFVPMQWGVHVGGASSSTVSEMAYCVGAISRVRYIRKRFGRSVVTSTFVLFVALVEFVTRTVTRQAEGTSARAKSVRLQTMEILRPGTVVLLK
ncbi:glycosyltransferase family 2 protein [Cryobacterium sp. Hz7]|uniref:glycosyltransferase family 2 protein n=1 Tax=Cryobacterium sp. Hz7 TaxID=1259166 RepID=UPI001069B6E7|nr:glycosyltransferase [Cryobacterium sp. Hz7]TFB60252.1 glycosyltransferase family 2 protein [Cryobacterium sp. Hz7]